MVYLLYDILLVFAALFLIPFYLLRGLRHGKRRRGIRERLGFFEPGRLDCLQGKEVLWIHAVSVGETRAAIPLVRALRKAYPQKAILLTNVTETGHAIAKGVADVDLCLFFPFDLTWVVRRVLHRIAPSLIVIVETEIWPNFVREAGRRNVPVLLVNGRISDRSFPRYRMAKPLLEPILEHISFFCMQSDQDAERIRLMGAPEAKIATTGNLKFDMEAPVIDDVDDLREEYRIPGGLQVWVAGSTHPGEEELILETFSRLLEEGRKLLLILVPRHPERCRMIGDALSDGEYRYLLRSELGDATSPLSSGEVLLVDTMGEMLKLYAVADVVFVGGSFVDIGGHNVLEASLMKKPVLFGPYMHNFKEISRLLVECGGGVMLDEPKELEPAIQRLLLDQRERIALGERGVALLERNTGATRKTAAVIERLLEG